MTGRDELVERLQAAAAAWSVMTIAEQTATGCASAAAYQARSVRRWLGEGPLRPAGDRHQRLTPETAAIAACIEARRAEAGIAATPP